MEDDLAIVKKAYDAVIEAVKGLTDNQRERVLRAVEIILEPPDAS